jgi:uncharacterized membrane protein (DUF485 family)
MSETRPPDWEALSRSERFQALLRAKRRFVIPCCVFFLLYYFALLYLVGWQPELMKRPALGKVNWAYLFALSQFFMAWGMAWIYVRKAAVLDRMAAEVIRDETH